ncbi:tRNA pseudouridine synthase B [Frankliniella fusca]|uniref:tRNA pseudouridine synthase B n=1 Tax=Frankliniella fusca TaxID=407009 RepID=A0AAE1L811_9NEOP|nr:tRNA pseudouridine synthase B [Frankliniella fusca]
MPSFESHLKQSLYVKLSIAHVSGSRRSEGPCPVHLSCLPVRRLPAEHVPVAGHLQAATRLTYALYVSETSCARRAHGTVGSRRPPSLFSRLSARSRFATNFRKTASSGGNASWRGFLALVRLRTSCHMALWKDSAARSDGSSGWPTYLEIENKRLLVALSGAPHERLVIAWEVYRPVGQSRPAGLRADDIHILVGESLALVHVHAVHAQHRLGDRHAEQVQPHGLLLGAKTLGVAACRMELVQPLEVHSDAVAAALLLAELEVARRFDVLRTVLQGAQGLVVHRREWGVLGEPGIHPQAVPHLGGFLGIRDRVPELREHVEGQLGVQGALEDGAGEARRELEAALDDDGQADGEALSRSASALSSARGASSHCRKARSSSSDSSSATDGMERPLRTKRDSMLAFQASISARRLASSDSGEAGISRIHSISWRVNGFTPNELVLHPSARELVQHRHSRPGDHVADAVLGLLVAQLEQRVQAEGVVVVDLALEAEPALDVGDHSGFLLGRQGLHAVLPVHGVGALPHRAPYLLPRLGVGVREALRQVVDALGHLLLRLAQYQVLVQDVHKGDGGPQGLGFELVQFGAIVDPGAVHLEHVPVEDGRQPDIHAVEVLVDVDDGHGAHLEVRVIVVQLLARVVHVVLTNLTVSVHVQVDDAFDRQQLHEAVRIRAAQGLILVRQMVPPRMEPLTSRHTQVVSTCGASPCGPGVSAGGAWAAAAAAAGVSAVDPVVSGMVTFTGAPGTKSQRKRAVSFGKAVLEIASRCKHNPTLKEAYRCQSIKESLIHGVGGYYQSDLDH